jgi:hypothetical protein
VTPLENNLGSGELVAWRLDQNEYHETWDSSEGSYKFGGRWSASGVWAIYCSIDRILGKYTEYDRLAIIVSDQLISSVGVDQALVARCVEVGGVLPIIACCPSAFAENPAPVSSLDERHSIIGLSRHCG